MNKHHRSEGHAPSGVGSSRQIMHKQEGMSVPKGAHEIDLVTTGRKADSDTDTLVAEGHQAHHKGNGSTSYGEGWNQKSSKPKAYAETTFGAKDEKYCGGGRAHFAAGGVGKIRKGQYK